MKVAVSSSGNDLSAPVSPVFGRCPTYIFVDTETMEFEALANPAMAAPGGAGIQAAQLVASKGVGAVLTGNVGPNAFNVLQSAGVPIFIATAGTVREVVEAYKAGKLQPIGQSTAGPYTGMGGGMGMGRGMGRGMGMGMGRGMGRGMWGGGGWGSYVPPTAPQPGAPPSAPMPGAQASTALGEELSSLKGEIKSLSEQLDEVLKRLDRLEKKG